MKDFLTLTLPSIGLLAVMLPTAKADESNQKTVVTFSEPVEIPGQVLAAGTYVFILVSFDERMSGNLEALRAWFYPGDNYGHDFVHPKFRAVALASTNSQPVASMPTELLGNTTKPTQSITQPDVAARKQAPRKAQRPTGEEVEVTEAVVVPQAARGIPPSPTETSLPETAASLPRIGLLGLVSLGVAVCVPKLVPAENRQA